MKKVMNFMKKHVKKIVGGVIGVLVTLLTFGLLNAYKSNHEEEEA